jgi:hypothetical protein
MFLFFLRSLVKGQDHSFFKNLTGVFCTVGGTLVSVCNMHHIADFKMKMKVTKNLSYKPETIVPEYYK